MNKIFFLLLLVIEVSYCQTSLRGIIRPIQDIQISVSVDGKVDSVLLKEGDNVKKNQSILQIDSKLQQLEMSRRGIIYKDETKQKALQESISILEDLYKKKNELYSTTKAVSLNEINEIKMQLINAKGELAQKLEEKNREKVEYDISKEVLNLYTISSPIDGVIVQIKPKIGEWLQTGKDIIRVVNTKNCFVELDADISLLKFIKKNKKVKIEFFDANTNVQKDGVVEFVSAVADSASGLVRIKVVFENTDNLAIAGSMASVIFE